MELLTSNAPRRDESESSVVGARWWHGLEDGRIQCDLCPRLCRLHEGQRGFCFVREARRGGIVLTTYGRTSHCCADPVEKKPLNHFYPGSLVLSLGTAGCNLGCRYCQNWEMSKAREDRFVSDDLSPATIAERALHSGCRSIAFTYNDPVVFAEYAIDCAVEAHARGLKTVAVSNGYMTPSARSDFYEHIDAVNIDLKAFTESFYEKTCFAHLEPVLDTLKWLKHETDVWLEVTTLLIPGHNDSEAEVEELCVWFLENLGATVPLHFTAFYPDFKMMNVPPTPASTLSRARAQAKRMGIQHVYTGNTPDIEGQSSRCANCGRKVIGRDGCEITKWRLDDQGRCERCQERLPGHFDLPLR